MGCSGVSTRTRAQAGEQQAAITVSPTPAIFSQREGLRKDWAKHRNTLVANLQWMHNDQGSDEPYLWKRVKEADQQLSACSQDELMDVCRTYMFSIPNPYEPYDLTPRPDDGKAYFPDHVLPMVVSRLDSDHATALFKETAQAILSKKVGRDPAQRHKWQWHQTMMNALAFYTPRPIRQQVADFIDRFDQAYPDQPDKIRQAREYKAFLATVDVGQRAKLFTKVWIKGYPDSLRQHMQLAVAHQFHQADVVNCYWGTTRYGMVVRDPDPEIVEVVGYLHQRTQAYYRKTGVDEVKAYRGVIAKKFIQYDAPISSWTTSRSKAKTFGDKVMSTILATRSILFSYAAAPDLWPSSAEGVSKQDEEDYRAESEVVVLAEYLPVL